MVKKDKNILTKAFKKMAVARVRLKEGAGSIKINGVPVFLHKPLAAQDIIMEPVILAREVFGLHFEYGLDIDANVAGGGIMGQAYAVRTVVGKALLKWGESEELKKIYHDYDRSLFIDDVRRKEPKKYLRKGARAKPIKSYR